jgi:hypothetical protein
MPTFKRRRSIIVVAEAASPSSAPKLTNKPAWAGMSAIELAKSEEAEQRDACYRS